MSAALPFFRHPHWPLPIGLVPAVLLIGVTLLAAAIAARRKSAIAGDVVLLLAAVWNAGIVFAFVSPHNRHVFHRRRTARASS